MVLCYSSPSKPMHHLPPYHLASACHPCSLQRETFPGPSLWITSSPLQHGSECLSTSLCHSCRKPGKMRNSGFWFCCLSLKLIMYGIAPALEGAKMPGNQKEWQMSNVTDFVIVNFKSASIMLMPLFKSFFYFYWGVSDFQIAVILHVIYVCPYVFASVEPCLK